MSRPLHFLRRLLSLLTALPVAFALVAVTLPVRADAAGTNPVTPGSFTGYGFDQCLTPTQATMNTWLNHSPFLAVGIYISGDSRACRNQPNLTPAWVKAQLSKGWRLLPITLGPQASCQPRFPRYKDDFKINPKPGKVNGYSIAKKQGTTEGGRSVAAAKALGIVPASTLWYDLEGFNLGDTHCRESALQFLSGWVAQVRALGYKAGVYSSAGSGIKMLDDARVNRPGKFALPDAVWIARWDGIANTSTSYLREDGWRPGGRVKQYMGGHDETWGGVRVNIDRNFLDVGRGSAATPENRCGGIRIGFYRYDGLRQPTKAGRKSPADQVKALQCLLQERGLYTGQLGGNFNPQLLASVQEWQRRTHFPVNEVWSRKNWVTIFAAGDRPVLKFGSAGVNVRRVQRALNAMYPTLSLATTGTFDIRTHNAVRAWQKDAGIPVSGVVNPASWAALAKAVR
jgi:hypothetical protein